MNFKLTAILLSMLFLIAGAVLMLTLFSHQGTSSSSNINLVFSTVPTDLNEITFAEGEQVRLAFGTENGKWQMVYPIKAKVNT